MAYTDTWNAAFEASPADGDTVSEGAERIRDTRIGIRERMEKDHYMAVAGTDADHGEHAKVTLRVGSAPTPEANKGYLYAKDVSSIAELHYINENSVETQLTGLGSGGWVAVPSASFTSTPASTSTLTFGVDHSSIIKAGMAIKYTIAATTYYGVITVMASNLMTIAGPPLGAAVTALYYGGGTVRNVEFVISGALGVTSNTLLAAVRKAPYVWRYQPSYLVKNSFWAYTCDTGGMSASALVGGATLGTGYVAMVADKTWYHSVVDILPAAYACVYGTAIELSYVADAGDASDLVALLTFVTP